MLSWSYAPSAVTEATGSATWSSKGPTWEASSSSRSVRVAATLRPVSASTPRWRCYGVAGTGWHDRRRKQPTERPMPQPNDLSRSPIALNQDGTLIAVIEMSQSSWLVAGIVPGIARHPLKKLAADAAALLGSLERWR